MKYVPFPIARDQCITHQFWLDWNNINFNLYWSLQYTSLLLKQYFVTTLRHWNLALFHVQTFSPILFWLHPSVLNHQAVVPLDRNDVTLGSFLSDSWRFSSNSCTRPDFCFVLMNFVHKALNFSGYHNMRCVLGSADWWNRNFYAILVKNFHNMNFEWLVQQLYLRE